jgi:hypothetical protein
MTPSKFINESVVEDVLRGFASGLQINNGLQETLIIYTAAGTAAISSPWGTSSGSLRRLSDRPALRPRRTLGEWRHA